MSEAIKHFDFLQIFPTRPRSGCFFSQPQAVKECREAVNLMLEMQRPAQGDYLWDRAWRQVSTSMVSFPTSEPLGLQRVRIPHVPSGNLPAFEHDHRNSGFSPVRYVTNYQRVTSARSLSAFLTLRITLLRVIPTMAFCLTYILAFYPTFNLAYILTFYLSFYLANILTFYLAFYRAFNLV